ncbi:MAG: MBL fold metallo-hydrolase [Oscillospiraceae bacterium]|nr:MBL fold metallo-hydrolase [Oscillospiraceae bacterium]
MKHIRTLIIYLTVLLSVQCAASGCSLKKTYSSIDISFLKVGKADAIVIRTPDHAVLIDAANQGEGKEIYAFCEENGYTELDYFILTHFDSDHVGGARAVVNKFSVKNILQPDYTENSKEFKNYSEAVLEKGYTVQTVTDTVTFELDDVYFKVYPSSGGPYDDVNNYSLVITATHGNNSFIFAGDAEKERIKECMDQIPQRTKGWSLIKMPHHGGYEKNLDDFIRFIRPEYAVVTCSSGSPADDRTLNLLGETGTEVYYTCDGGITFTSDGYKLVHTSIS